MKEFHVGARQYVLLEGPPSMEAFVALRADEGWGQIAPDAARRALGASLFSMSIVCGDETVGFGRLVGDGVLYFFLTDVVVRADHRGCGLGDVIVRSLMEFALAAGGRSGSIGLMSASGKESFYARYGFVARPDDRFGAGMTWVAEPPAPGRST